MLLGHLLLIHAQCWCTFFQGHVALMPWWNVLIKHDFEIGSIIHLLIWKCPSSHTVRVFFSVSITVLRVGTVIWRWTSTGYLICFSDRPKNPIVSCPQKGLGVLFLSSYLSDGTGSGLMGRDLSFCWACGRDKGKRLAAGCRAAGSSGSAEAGPHCGQLMIAVCDLPCTWAATLQDFFPILWHSDPSSPSPRSAIHSACPGLQCLGGKMGNLMLPRESYQKGLCY